MKNTTIISSAEEAQLVSKLIELYPAAAMLKSVHLEEGRFRAGLDTPLGKLDAILELVVQPNG